MLVLLRLMHLGLGHITLPRVSLDTRQQRQDAPPPPPVMDWRIASAMEQLFPTAPWALPAGSDGAAAGLRGARAERLAFQVAIRPSEPLRQLSVVTSPLEPVKPGESTSNIPASAVYPARRVLCVNVTRGSTGTEAYPDPLPLLSSADELPPGTTSALWVTLAVPVDTPPGIYRGSLSIYGSLGAEPVARLARIPLSVTVLNLSVAERSLRTDSKLSEQWVGRYSKREPDGANLTAVMLRYYREMADHRVTMMGWGGVSIFPAITANFSADLSAVSLNTTGFDRMAAALEEMGIKRLHFPLPSQCSCCEPITHIRKPIPQVIPPNATWWLAGSAPDSTIQVFDATLSTLEQPVLNSTFVRGFTTLVRAISAHLTARGWLSSSLEQQQKQQHEIGGERWRHVGLVGRGRLDANFMLFIDEVDITDPFTARALLLLDRFMKGLEPRLRIAQTRFPTNQYGQQNQTLVSEIEGVVDEWVASIDECLLRTVQF